MAGLQGRERELAKNLAGGWRQRLALGCAIIHEPEMLFLDEPTAGVDPISRREFWNLLYLFSSEGRTIFVTTHYMDEAEHCHRLSFIQQGRLVALGSPEEIKREKMHGQVLEIDCSRPDVAVRELRADGHFGEIALYGALVHVVTENVESFRPAINEKINQSWPGSAGYGTYCSIIGRRIYRQRRAAGGNWPDLVGVSYLRGLEI